MSSEERRKAFGKRLRKLRQAMNMKYREAAERGDISIAMVAAIEIGKIQKPGINTIRGIHAIYKLPVKQIEAIYYGRIKDVK
jgi:transcriptional regulator with XRE-family HTH domain